jgi:hypothetical protein
MQVWKMSLAFLWLALCSGPVAAQHYGDYPPDYPFGKSGTQEHPNGFDGFPGDTPPHTPGAPAGCPPNGGPGGHGIGPGNGGQGGAAFAPGFRASPLNGASLCRQAGQGVR